MLYHNCPVRIDIGGMSWYGRVISSISEKRLSARPHLKAYKIEASNGVFQEIYDNCLTLLSEEEYFARIIES